MLVIAILISIPFYYINIMCFMARDESAKDTIESRSWQRKHCCRRILTLIHFIKNLNNTINLSFYKTDWCGKFNLTRKISLTLWVWYSAMNVQYFYGLLKIVYYLWNALWAEKNIISVFIHEFPVPFKRNMYFLRHVSRKCIQCK